MSKPTRKSIGDKWGDRSIWIVECHFKYTFAMRHWIPYWGEKASSVNRNDAVKMKDNIYKRLKKFNSRWTRKDFRVVLYVRAERE